MNGWFLLVNVSKYTITWILWGNCTTIPIGEFLTRLAFLRFLAKQDSSSNDFFAKESRADITKERPPKKEGGCNFQIVGAAACVFFNQHTKLGIMASQLFGGHCSCCSTHRIHVWYICHYLPTSTCFCMVNVGKYTKNTRIPMGYWIPEW